MNCLAKFSTPQLKIIHSGKVRESIALDNNTRMIVVTDRISAFDRVLKTPIPYKGAVLNGISNFWFEKTKNIVDNHFIKSIDPNITIVKEAVPIKLEMIVRKYITGSMWNAYKKGRREFAGIKLPEGMKKNDKFDKPVITPTTKEEVDREISPDNIIKVGLVNKGIYEQLKALSLKLFEIGTDFLKEKGIILVDTKYEFGIINDKVILIDEIHTPDSSRFWKAKDYKNDPDNVEQIDKEYVRQWLLSNKVDGQYPNILPEKIVKETTRRYIEIYEMILGKRLDVEDDENIRERVYKNLVKAEIIKEGYVAIIMGSPSDLEHCKKIQNYIKEYGIKTDLRVVSAHKNGEEIIKIADEYNSSIEPGAIIAVAGMSNGLGGALAANLNIPVFSCPPFKDNLDMLVNINSSLIMPSNTPAATVINPKNVAHAALRSLNLYHLRKRFNKEIEGVKGSLIEADRKIREA